MREWLEANPLRLWRLGQGPPRRRSWVAAQIGVTTPCVAHWETSRRRPSEDSWECIKWLTGLSRQAWDTWLPARPED